MISTQRYTSWGETRSGSASTTFGYTGQREEDALGIIYFNARWYDPALGRFLSADTVVPGPGSPLAWDRYAYSFNNPLNFYDPSGHSPCDVNGADPECKNSAVKYYSQINERKAAEEKFLKDPFNLSSRFEKEAPITPYHRYGIWPSTGEPTNPYLQMLDEFIPYVDYYSNASEIIDMLVYIDNYGTPVYKQWKGSLPGGPVIEFGLGALTQFSSDITDTSRIRQRRDIISRVSAAGVEDAITESVASPVGKLGAAAGTLCGPGAPICMPVGYLVGANAATWIMDNVVWKPINTSAHFYRKTD